MFCDLSFIFPFSFVHIMSYLLQLALQTASHNLTILTVCFWYEAEAVFVGCVLSVSQLDNLKDKDYYVKHCSVSSMNLVCSVCAVS